MSQDCKESKVGENKTIQNAIFWQVKKYKWNKLTKKKKKVVWNDWNLLLQYAI